MSLSLAAPALIKVCTSGSVHTDLSPLSGEIKNALIISGTGDDIAGLDTLSELNSVFISDNPSLVSLNGLSIADSNLSKGIVITRNDVLTDLSALSGLTDLPIVSISENAALSNLDALSGLTNVGGSGFFRVAGVDPNGNLTFFSRNGLRIGGANLSDVTGIANLRTTQDLTVEDAPQLRQLPHFRNISELSGYLFRGRA